MFGMGGSEILVILIVALIFLGPDKLPEAAKQISKGLRDLRKHTRQIQESIENDTQVGGAIRDLKSALRGDELRAPFEDMRRQVQAAVSSATAPAALPGKATAGAPPAALAGAGDAPAKAATATAMVGPDVATEPAAVAPPADANTSAMPVFRQPAHTLAKGAPIEVAGVTAAANGAADGTGEPPADATAATATTDANDTSATTAANDTSATTAVPVLPAASHKPS